MAYWLYCLTCKQWSKSDTPLSDDKICTHCNSLFVQAKQLSRINLDLDKITVERLKTGKSTPTIPQTNDLNDASIKAESPKEIIEQEPHQSTEVQVDDDPASITTMSESNTDVKEAESLTVEGLATTPDMSKSNDVEIPENKGEKTKLVELNENQIPDQVEQETTSIPESAELTETQEDDATNEIHETTEFEEASDEPDSDEVQESEADISTPEQSESLPKTDENLESSAEEEKSEETKSENIPAHRIYMENKRRRRKQ